MYSYVQEILKVLIQLNHFVEALPEILRVGNEFQNILEKTLLKKLLKNQIFEKSILNNSAAVHPF